MKLKVFIFILIIAFVLICLFPTESMLKDGGTKIYEPIIPVYTIYKYNMLDANGFIKGYAVYIFGCEVYENTYLVLDEAE